MTALLAHRACDKSASARGVTLARAPDQLLDRRNVESAGSGTTMLVNMLQSSQHVASCKTCKRHNPAKHANDVNSDTRGR